jgi:hypothetical protein
LSTDKAKISGTIEIINYWFNDQPNPDGDTNDRAKYKTNAADSQEYKFVHSKVISTPLEFLPITINPLLVFAIFGLEIF